MSTLSIRSKAQSSLFSALHHPNFRLYFITQLVSFSGTWMQKVASGWLVFHLTRSELWLGLIACAAGLPSLLFSPLAGVLVDRFPKRRIVIVTQTVQMLLALILALMVFADAVQVWHIVVLSFFSGMMDALDAPARQAFILDMVDRSSLSSGIVLNSIMTNTARIFGPTITGIALVQWGAGWCFLLNGMSFLAVIGGLYAMHVIEKQPKVSSIPFMERLRAGLNYSRHHPTIMPLLVLATVGSIFIVNMATLMPAFADEVLRSPKEGYAILSATQGFGAICAGLLASWLHKNLKVRGLIVSISAMLTPLAILLLAISTNLLAAAIMVTICGLGIVLQFVTVNTLIQSQVPDEFRGRVLSLYTLTFFGIAPFGALVLGSIADVIGTPLALMLYAAIGGILSAAVIWKSPLLRKLS